MGVSGETMKLLIGMMSYLMLVYITLVRKIDDWNFPILKILYLDGLPTTRFFANIGKNSLVVIDDQYSDATRAEQIDRAFKFDRRHNRFSIILITQSIYEKGNSCKSIRNNTEIFVLFRNFGDAKINKMLTSQLELKKRYLNCLEDASQVTHGYWNGYEIALNTTFSSNIHFMI